MDGEIVEMDRVGRIVVPKRLRKAFKTFRFFIQADDGELRLRPLKSWDELFGCLPNLDRRDLDELDREDGLDEPVLGHVRVVRSRKRDR